MPSHPKTEASRNRRAIMARSLPSRARHLAVILGDQLDRKSAALDGLDLRHDAVWIPEVAEESIPLSEMS